MASTSTEAREQSKAVASTAVDQARDVGRTAQDGAQTVAQDVKEEVGQVADDLRQQARTMVDDTRAQLREKANAQTAGVADGLGRFAEELRALTSGHPEEAETARRYLDQAGSAIADVAGQLRGKDFQGVVQDVQRFARRRPGMFLAATAAAGFVAGRLVRSTRDDADGPTSDSGTNGVALAANAGTAGAGASSGISGVGATTVPTVPITAEAPTSAGEGS